MKSEEIKTECEWMYTRIKASNQRLEELRKICPHENTFEGNWSWRIGSDMPAIICSDCGGLIKFKNSLPIENMQNINKLLK